MQMKEYEDSFEVVRLSPSPLLHSISSNRIFSNESKSKTNAFSFRFRVSDNTFNNDHSSENDQFQYLYGNERGVARERDR